MAERLWRAELTASFQTRLDEIEAFLEAADAGFAFDQLLVELRTTVIPNLQRFPQIGKRCLDDPPQSVEAMNRLAELPVGMPDMLRVYLHGDYLVLYLADDERRSVSLLTIRHHRELSFDFDRVWTSGAAG